MSATSSGLRLTRLHPRHSRLPQAGPFCFAISRRCWHAPRRFAKRSLNSPSIIAAPASSVVAPPRPAGLLFAAPLALETGAIGIRAGPQAGQTAVRTRHAFRYELEYGTDTLEMHIDGVAPGQNVLLVDDLLATGGTMQACCRLVEQAGAKVAGCAFVIELLGLKGAARLAPHSTFSLIQYP